MFLKVRGLRSGYQHGTVLSGVDLDLARGQSLALLGRNGVGKSTLAMTLVGLLPATSGSIVLDGVELTRKAPHEIARVGVAFVPQGRRIWSTLTVQEHLDLTERGARFRGVPARWTQPVLRRLLPRLAERPHQLAGQLSGGEQQMLAIARGLLRQPALLILDEPSEGLAPLIIEQLAGLLKTVSTEGVTVILIEQDLHLAFSVGQEVAVMERGALVHRSPTAAFRRDPATANRLLGVDVGDDRGADEAEGRPGRSSGERLHHGAG